MHQYRCWCSCLLKRNEIDGRWCKALIWNISCHANAFDCQLTHWGRVTHMCVSKLTIIGSYNGLSPGRRRAFIWTNVGIWSIRPLEINFSDILFGIQTFSFKKMHLQMSSAKCRPFCLGLNVLRRWSPVTQNCVLLSLHVSNTRDDSRSAPNQWETALLCKDDFHWRVQT